MTIKRWESTWVCQRTQALASDRRGETGCGGKEVRAARFCPPGVAMRTPVPSENLRGLAARFSRPGWAIYMRQNAIHILAVK
jgi:hypothetical protein